MGIFKKEILFISMLVSFIFFSCQKYYEPDDIEANKKIPVLEGSITNNQGPHHVKLYYALPFDAMEFNYEPITGAIITILCDEGNYVILEENSPGNYSSKRGQMEGITGNSYWVEVKIDDEIYESTPDVMRPAQQIDTIYGIIGKILEKEKNSYGDVIVKEYPGIQLLLDMNPIPGESKFVRFSFNYIAQKIFFVGEPSFQTTVYFWEYGVLNKIPVVASANFDGSEYHLKSLNTGFLRYEIKDIPYSDTVYGDTSFTSYPRGWTVTSKSMVISEDAYNYYNAINNQLEAKDRIFDPIASQIPGNITCMTDSTKKMFGLFEVASVSTTYSYHFWSIGNRNVKNKRLDSYNKPDSAGFIFGSEPDYWISPYD